MKAASILTAIIILLLIHSTFAFNVYLRPPRLVARMNLTQSQVYNGFLEVKNQNNVSTNITFKPTGNITDKITFSKEMISLNPNEAWINNFTLTVSQPGIYKGDVLVTYSAENMTVPITLQAEITIIAEGQVKQEKANNTILYLAVILIALLLILILFKVKKR